MRFRRAIVPITIIACVAVSALVGVLLANLRQGGSSLVNITATDTPTSVLPASATPNPAANAPCGDGFTTPAMGWNPYNAFSNTTAVNETMIRQTIDVMATNGMRAAGYCYINLDDDWQGNRDNKGNLQPNAQFPSGMKALIDYAHSKGFKFGLYTSPGTKTCSGRVGSRGHIQQDVSEFAAWGIDYLKVDMCDDAWTKDSVQADAQAFSQAIKNTGRPIVLSFSSGGAGNPWTWPLSDGVQSYRVSDDICQAWIVTAASTDRYCYRPPAGGLYSIATGSDGGHLPQAAPSTAPGHVLDADLLEVGNPGLSNDEQDTHISLWAMFASPLIASDDQRTATPEDLARFTNPGVIAVDQDKLVKSATQVYGKDGVSGWAKPLADGGFAVALVDGNGGSAAVSITWNQVGIPAGSYTLQDLWTNQITNNATGWNGTIPSHGIIFLKVGGTPIPYGAWK